METDVSQNDTKLLLKESIQKLKQTQKQYKTGVLWFYIIAGFSLINTLVFMLGGGIVFIVGLGISHLIDIYLSGIHLFSVYSTVILVFWLITTLLMASIFIAIGNLGMQGKKWVIIIGLIIYGIDGIIKIFLFLDFQMFFLIVVFIGLIGAVINHKRISLQKKEIWGLIKESKKGRDVQSIQSDQDLLKELPSENFQEKPITQQPTNKLKSRKRQRKTLWIGLALTVYSVIFIFLGLTRVQKNQQDFQNMVIFPMFLETKINQIDSMTMVYIPEGVFIMGSDDQNVFPSEKPAHEVYLDSFWIYQTPVTNKMFGQFIESTGFMTFAEIMGESLTFSESGELVSLVGANWTAPEGLGSTIVELNDYPAVQINWIDASSYCEWAGGRLPTEAEWEKAARGPYGVIFPWGNLPISGERANYCDVNCPFPWAAIAHDDKYARLAPVGSYPAGISYYGVLDMAGNVWEWCYDWLQADYYHESPYNNPLGPNEGELKVIRGGSCYNSTDALRSTRRDGLPPLVSTPVMGFRCVID